MGANTILAIFFWIFLLVAYLIFVVKLYNQKHAGKPSPPPLILILLVSGFSFMVLATFIATFLRDFSALLNVFNFLAGAALAATLFLHLVFNVGEAQDED